MNLLHRLLLPRIPFADLDAYLRQQWARRNSLSFRNEDAAEHEVIAVLTALGWQLKDAGSGRYYLQRPTAGSINPIHTDWQSERQHWSSTSRGSGSHGKGAPTHSPAQPTRTLGQRRCHIFGIGIAKSGTTSLTGLFSQYHSAHEVEPTFTMRSIAIGQKMDLAARDARTGYLECDSSQHHHAYLADLVATFPTAKFVLTIRQPRAWLESIINHRLARGLMPEWSAWEQHRFGPPSTSTTGPDALLAALGRPGLDSYLAFWAKHHQHVLDTVPADRLLVVPLEQLSAQKECIAQFAGVPTSTLTAESSHLNAARARYYILERLPQDYLQAVLDRYCTQLWATLIARAVV